MTHLRIEQNNGITEQVSPSVIEKLYEIVHSGNLDSSSNLMGSLNTTGTYLNYVDYLEELFTKNGVRLLVITANKLYMDFADPAVLSRMMQYLGDGIGITSSEITNGNWYSNTTDPNTNSTLFTNNTSITSFNELGLLSLITNIPAKTFLGCTNLTDVDLHNITSIGHWAFNNSGITEADLSSILTLGVAIFSGCGNLESVTIGSGISSIDSQVFLNCTSLQSVIFPNTITWINGLVFQGCTNLLTINLDNITSTGDLAFRDCTSLTSVGDLSNFTSIGVNVFYNCSSLTTIENLSNITSIGGGSFRECTNLKTLEFSNTITIGNYAFNNCQKLEKIFNSNETSANITFSDKGSYAFFECRSLVFPLTVTISSNSTSGRADGNWLFCAFYNTHQLYDVILDSSVKGLSRSAFHNSHLTSIAAPYVEAIGNHAFCGVNASVIELPSLQTYCRGSGVSEYTIFAYCSNLLKVTLGHFSERISSNSDSGSDRGWFCGTPNLKIFDVGDSITEYECNAMGGNFRGSGASLEKFIIRNTTVPTLSISKIPLNLQTPEVIISNFGGTSVRIYVPDSALNDYKTATNWSIIASYIYPLSDIES